MCRNCLKLLTSPGEAVLAAKKKLSYKEAACALVTEAIVATIAVAIVSISIGTMDGSNPLATLMQQYMIYIASGVFLLVIVAELFVGLIVKLVATTLGGKGGYLQGLTTVAYAAFAPSIGLLVASILGLIPIVGGVLGFISLAVTLAVGIAAVYRSISELFSLEMITALVAVGVIALALMLPFYYVLGGTFLQNMSAMPGLGLV